MTTVQELREQRGDLLDAMGALIYDDDGNVKSHMPQRDADKYDRLERDLADLDKRISRAEKHQEEKMRTAKPIKAGLDADKPDPVQPLTPGAAHRSGTRQHGGPWFRDAAGNPVKGYGPGDSLAADYAKADGPGLGEFLRAKATGRGAKEVLGEGQIGTGGAFIAPALSARVIDEMRARQVLAPAGATTIPMGTASLSIARVEDDPEPAWRGENEPIPDSGPSFAQVNLIAKTLAVNIKVSLELLEDASNMEAEIRRMVAEKMAVKLDEAGLTGTGVGAEPMGILNDAKVPTIDHDAALTDYKPFTRAVTKIREANVGADLSAVHSPRTLGDLELLYASDGQPIQPPQSWQATSHFDTGSVPTSLGSTNDETVSIFGNFSSLLMGIRNQLAIEISSEAADASGSAWKDMQFWIRAYLRADFAVARPNDFVRIEGIKPS